jgi:hypothetical protein
MIKQLTLITILGASLLLSACSTTNEPLPSPTSNVSPNAETSSTPEPTKTSTPGDKTDNGIIVLSEDEASPYPDKVLSTPHGTWELQIGLPEGFPAGVPAFENESIKNEFRKSQTSEGLDLYGIDFWGGYDKIDSIIEYATTHNWQLISDETLETRRAVVIQNDNYRITITASESLQDKQDLMYSYAIAVLQ